MHTLGPYYKIAQILFDRTTILHLGNYRYTSCRIKVIRYDIRFVN